MCRLPINTVIGALLALLLLMSSCAKHSGGKLYPAVLTEDTEVYFGNEKHFTTSETVPSGTEIQLSARITDKGYRVVKYGRKIGYVHSPKYRGISTVRTRTAYRVVNNNTPTDTVHRRDTTKRVYRPTGGGTVHVKGHYRNGRYVKPHTRKAPRRR